MVGIVHQRNSIVRVSVLGATFFAANRLIKRDVRNMTGCGLTLELFVEMLLFPNKMHSDQVRFVPRDRVRLEPRQWRIVLKRGTKENHRKPVLRSEEHTSELQ